MATYLEINITQTNDSTVDLGFTAEAGTWTMFITVNGGSNVRKYTYGAGDPVIIDNILQNNAKHSIRFIDNTGSLMNDTYYTVITDDLSLANGIITNIIEITDTLTTMDGDSSFSSYQNDAMIGAKYIDVYAKMGTAYQLVRHSSFAQDTGTANFSGDDTLGSIDGQAIFIRVYK